jgi:hypothetical protein
MTIPPGASLTVMRFVSPGAARTTIAMFGSLSSGLERSSNSITAALAGVAVSARARGKRASNRMLR